MTSFLALPTKQHLRELFRYESATGALYWNYRLSHKASLDKPAGRIDTKDGYIQIGIHGKVYRRSRLVWAYFNDDPGSQLIDHINRVKSDDRIENLRIANSFQNSVNRLSSGSKYGCPGARKTDSGKWRAEIRINGKLKHLGIFADFADAKAAFASESLKHHKEFSIFNAIS